MLIIDEADNFFMDNTREEEIISLNRYLKSQIQRFQYVLVCLAKDEPISDKIDNLISEANHINLRPDAIELDNV